nr:hypothetical protein [Tanacetum cinerariifolium]
MASSTIPAIYIQQFWDTMCFDSSIGLYNCQLDDQWLNIHKDILRDALDIISTNDNNSFVAPPSSDTVIKYVNTLGYPCVLRNMSAMSINALYQPWIAMLSMINMCLTSKTVGYDRPRHHGRSASADINDQNNGNLHLNFRNLLLHFDHSKDGREMPCGIRGNITWGVGENALVLFWWFGGIREASVGVLGFGEKGSYWVVGVLDLGKTGPWCLGKMAAGFRLKVLVCSKFSPCHFY